jgi:hypothetical protein
MRVAFANSVSDIVRSDDGDDGEQQDVESPERGQLSEDDEPGWMLGTITKTVQQRMERFWQKHMKSNKSSHPGWDNTPAYYRDRETKYGLSEIRVPAVIQPQTDEDAAASGMTPLGELLECLDIVRGISQMLHGTFRLARSYMSLGSGKLRWNISIPCLAPGSESDWLLILNVKPVEHQQKLFQSR